MSVPPPLGETLGAIELGVLFSSILYGAMVLQVFHYHLLGSSAKDGILIKGLVSRGLIVLSYVSFVLLIISSLLALTIYSRFIQ